MLKGYMARVSLGTPEVEEVYVQFFICSAKNILSATGVGKQLIGTRHHKQLRQKYKQDLAILGRICIKPSRM